MEKRKVYVFDLDGTLVNSMPRYEAGMLSILDEAGIAYGDDLIKIITPLGYTKTAEYYINELGLDDSVASIV
jgi:beta-phosphoglucomutase-like phosphatase (HAD superfamily)